MSAVGDSGGATNRLRAALFPMLIAAFCLPGVAWISTVGDLADYWRYDVPDGQVVYLASKLVGLYAIAAFWLQLMYGLLGPRLRARYGLEFGNRFHRRLGVVVLTLILAHLALFIAGVSMRTNHLALHFLVPTFTDGYYRMIITLGWLGGVLVVLGMLNAGLRRRIGRLWRFGHWLMTPAFVLVVVHSWLIGSESRIVPMNVFYGLMLAGICWALAVRITLTRPAGSDRTA